MKWFLFFQEDVGGTKLSVPCSLSEKKTGDVSLLWLFHFCTQGWQFGITVENQDWLILKVLRREGEGNAFKPAKAHWVGFPVFLLKWAAMCPLLFLVNI